MSVLIDTSILARLANAADKHYAIAANAVLELHRRGEVLHITPQVMIEFRNVATRSKTLNGLGMAIVDAETRAAGFETRFSLLEETAAIFTTWKAIVGSLGIVGKQVHDARLVAVCHVHNVNQLLTMNVSHFTRMSAVGPGIVVIDPSTL